MATRGRAGLRLVVLCATVTASSCQAILGLDEYHVTSSVEGAIEPSDAGTGGETSAGGGTGGIDVANGAGGGAETIFSPDAPVPGAGHSDAGTRSDMADAADAGDAGVECTRDEQCPIDGECVVGVCVGGQCQVQPRDLGAACGDALDDACTDADTCDGTGICQPNHEARGTAILAPNGDCQITQCDGQGQPETLPDNNDVPADPGTGCSQPACLAGVPISVPRDRGTGCESGGLCDGDGNCVECLGDDDCVTPRPFCNAGLCVECTDASQCADPAVDCRIAACTGNTCGSAPAPNTTPCDDGFFCTLNDACRNGFCNGDQRSCPNTEPRCSETFQRCVECTSNAHCESPSSCDLQNGQCRS